MVMDCLSELPLSVFKLWYKELKFSQFVEECASSMIISGNSNLFISILELIYETRIGQSI